jgi:hypothetical protein
MDVPPNPVSIDCAPELKWIQAHVLRAHREDQNRVSIRYHILWEFSRYKLKPEAYLDQICDAGYTAHIKERDESGYCDTEPDLVKYLEVTWS